MSTTLEIHHVPVDKYWSGELYIDEGKKIYSRLGLQSKGITSGFGLLSSAVRENSKRASKAGIEGNLKGDGFQLGATYVIDENGSLLAEFKQVSVVPLLRTRTRNISTRDIDVDLP